MDNFTEKEIAVRWFSNRLSDYGILYPIISVTSSIDSLCLEAQSSPDDKKPWEAKAEWRGKIFPPDFRLIVG